MKTNFKHSSDINNATQKRTIETDENITKDATQLEFEEFISKAGAAGSFMIFRSDKKDDELGLEQL